jgi:hypothetical protein
VTPRPLWAALAGALLSAGLVAGSNVPWVAEPADQAMIRLSWRAFGERVEECREPSAEEQADLPPHMRQPRICEGRLLPFRLVVRIDGTGRFDALLPVGGAHADRPTIVFRDFRVTTGPHRVEIRFEVERPPGSGPATQPPLRLDETLELASREILLVTRASDEEGGGLRSVERHRD